MTRPSDRVERLGGIANLPAEFREVARLANLAGIEGYRVQDVEIGNDVEAYACEIRTHVASPRTYITITYREKAE